MCLAHDKKKYLWNDDIFIGSNFLIPAHPDHTVVTEENDQFSSQMYPFFFFWAEHKKNEIKQNGTIQANEPNKIMKFSF